jgi:hypothetical protein
MTISLIQPPIGTLDWGADLNSNWSSLGSMLNAGGIALVPGAGQNAFTARYDSSNEQSGLYTNAAGQTYCGTNIDYNAGDTYSRGSIPAARWGNPTGDTANAWILSVAAAGMAGSAISWTTALRVSTAGNVTVVPTTAATSPSTGSLIVNGGFGNASSTYVGGLFSLAQDVYFEPASAYSSATVRYIVHDPIYNSSGTHTTVARLELGRSSTTDGGTDGYISISTRKTGSSLTEAARFEKTGNFLVGGTSDDGNSRLQAMQTITLAANVTDGYAGSLSSAPGYSQAYTVTRHNYVTMKDPVLTASAVVTDACAIRFDAAAGTHKAVDGSSTKSTPGGVDAWIKLNINGSLYFMPAYLSKTA